MQNALKKFEEWGIRRRSERNRRNAERRRRLASTLGIEDADAALDLSTIQMGEMVGQGGFSIVYLCRLVDGRNAVAKVIKGGLSPSDTLLLRNEIAIWSRLSHPNLLSFIGTALGTDTCAIICEYCSGGSLYERHRQNLQLGKPPLGRDALVGQLVQVARGMEYLHSLRPHPVLHRDLKSHNILVAHDGRLVVADFGLARFHVTANAAEMTAETGSYRWMAPEVIRHEPYDERCDVYSFGVLGWEMVTYSIPFLHQTPVQVHAPPPPPATATPPPRHRPAAPHPAPPSTTGGHRRGARLAPPAPPRAHPRRRQGDPRELLAPPARRAPRFLDARVQARAAVAPPVVLVVARQPLRQGLALAVAPPGAPVPAARPLALAVALAQLVEVRVAQRLALAVAAVVSVAARRPVARAQPLAAAPRRGSGHPLRRERRSHALGVGAVGARRDGRRRRDGALADASVLDRRLARRAELPGAASPSTARLDQRPRRRALHGALALGGAVARALDITLPHPITHRTLEALCRGSCSIPSPECPLLPLLPALFRHTGPMQQPCCAACPPDGFL